jgi:Ca-activated chloride channel family protein
VNTLLLDRLARDNRGVAEYVVQDEDLESKIGGFYAKISNPVLANVKLSVSGIQLVDPYPSRLPDLFAGTQLLVLARYKGQGKATVTLTGELDGKPQRFTYELAAPERELTNEFIPKLWAGRRIGFLLEEIRLHGENAELKDEVVRLSKEHGIVTPYTSYLVEEAGPAGQPPSPRAADGSFGRQGILGGMPGGYGGFGGGAAGAVTNPFNSNSTGAGGQSDKPTFTNQETKKEPYYRSSQRGAAPAAKPGTTATAEKAKAPASNSTVAGKRAANGQIQDATKNAYGYNIQAQAPYLQQAEGFRHSTGLNAVEASRRVQQLKDKAQADTDVDVAHTVEGREFRLVNGIWTDRTISGKPQVVLVKYASDAYFALVAAHPAWARFLAQGRAVTFRSGKNVVVKVGASGQEKLTSTELKALER